MQKEFSDKLMGLVENNKQKQHKQIAQDFKMQTSVLISNSKSKSLISIQDKFIEGLPWMTQSDLDFYKNTKDLITDAEKERLYLLLKEK